MSVFCVIVEELDYDAVGTVVRKKVAIKMELQVSTPLGQMERERLRIAISVVH